MTVETTLQKLFDKCPVLFSTRKECYDHLFCVIGNGFEWKRGQLVYCGDEENPNLENEENADYAFPPSQAKQSEENIRKKNEYEQLVISHNPKRKEDFNFKWYPICEYSRIMNVPIDIKPDWKDAVEECRRMLKEDGINLDETGC